MRGARLSVMAKGATIFEPPPLDGSKAPIENVLELTPVVDIGPVSAHFIIIIITITFLVLITR